MMCGGTKWIMRSSLIGRHAPGGCAKREREKAAQELRFIAKPRAKIVSARSCLKNLQLFEIMLHVAATRCYGRR
jgi:hypothetical protein